MSKLFIAILLIVISLKIFSFRNSDSNNLLSSFDGYGNTFDPENAEKLMAIPINLFQGYFNFANTLGFDSNHETSYKIKSILPTVSASMDLTKIWS